MIIDIVLLFTEGRGGLENVIRKVYLGLKERKHEVRILQAYPSFNEEWLKDLDSVFYFSHATKLWKEDEFELALDYQRTLKEIGIPDIIIATHTTIMSAICKLAVAFMGENMPPIVSWLHGEIECYGGGELLKWCDGHLAISKGLGRDIKRTIEDTTEVYYIGNPVVTETKQCIKQINMPLKLIYIGRLENKQKRIDILLEAVAQLTCTWELKIIGEGPHKEWLQALSKSLNIEKHIEWLGWQKDPWKQVSEATVSIVTSDKEVFGLVLVESIQRGIPVIATACVGPQDIIIEGENGWLINLGDSKQLAVLLQEIGEGIKKLPIPESVQQSIEVFKVTSVMNALENSLYAIYYKHKCKKHKL